jgi:hypothetical protein
MKLLTRFVARDQRAKILELERDIKRLVRVVDDFYDRLSDNAPQITTRKFSLIRSSIGYSYGSNFSPLKIS